MKLDDSCIANPKSEIANWTAHNCCWIQFETSDFGFEMQESSNFKLLPFVPMHCVKYVDAFSRSGYDLHSFDPMLHVFFFLDEEQINDGEDE